MQTAELKELYEKYAGRVYAFLFSLSHSEDTAFDLMQETFIKASQKLDLSRDESAVRVWLFKTARNLYYNHHKKISRVVHNDAIVEAAAARPDHSAEFRVLRDEIISNLTRSRPVLAEIFILKIDYELPFDEIAGVLGLSRRTLGRRQEEIRTIVSRCMKTQEGATKP